jgi:hypothetical protein
VSYQREHDFLLQTLGEALKCEPEAERRTNTHTIHWLTGSGELNAIEPTDFLFIDSIHTADRLASELNVHGPKVARFIAIRGTGAFGESGKCPPEAPCKGLFHAIKPWLNRNPGWFVYSHTDKLYGLTVLGRLEDDRPAELVHPWPPGYGPGTKLKAILAARHQSPPELRLQRQGSSDGPVGRCRLQTAPRANH